MPKDNECMPFKVFDSARVRFSRKTVIDGKIYGTACDISDEVKAELIKGGTDISELGLLPIGERARTDEKSPYTYPV